MNSRRIVKKLIPRKIFHAVEPYGHWAEAVLWNFVYGFPAYGLKVIGVTGTNGKTTTCYLIQKMLSSADYKTGLMTTVAIGVGDKIRPQLYHMTNLPSRLLLREIKKMRAQKIDYLVLETTSHALAQHRIAGVPYSLAVMTNVTHEHLDYHGTFENYVNAKRRLFKLTNRNRRGLRTGIINAEDPSAAKFASDIALAITYGVEKGEARAKSIKLAPNGSSYEVEIDDESYKITCKLPGKFNVYNSLAAVCVGRVLGLSTRQIEQGIAALSSVPGRMTSVEAGQDFSVIVDYAHTPDALEKVLEAARGIASGKVAIVFGATGDRDKTKRPEMGEVVARLADRIYLTDDETYSENPASIRKAVMDGIERADGASKTKEIDGRYEAIKRAFLEAKKGDVVLLTGIGHQDSRIMAGKKIPWNESEVARKILEADGILPEVI